MKNTFDKKKVEKIAKLSALKISSSELPYFSKQFNETIAIIDQFNKLNTKSVSEAYNISGKINVFRNDKIERKKVFTQKQALRNAKKTYKGYFLVPSVF